MLAWGFVAAREGGWPVSVVEAALDEVLGMETAMRLIQDVKLRRRESGGVYQSPVPRTPSGRTVESRTVVCNTVRRNRWLDVLIVSGVVVLCALWIGAM